MKKQYKYTWYDLTATELNTNPNALLCNTPNDAIFGEYYDLTNYYRDNVGIELQYYGNGIIDYTYTDENGNDHVIIIVIIMEIQWW